MSQKTEAQKAKDVLEKYGITINITDDVASVRDAYHYALQQLQGTDATDFKALQKALRAVKGAADEYMQYFHKYFGELHPHLLFEKNQETTYWEYNDADGVYEERHMLEVRSDIFKLLEEEHLRQYMKTAVVRDVISRYRGTYSARGVSYNDFDNDNDMLHCYNGWLNTRSCAFTDHDPKRLSLRKSAVSYDATATCPRYDTFMDGDLSVPEDVVRVLDQYSGLLLTPDIEYEKMLTITGTAGSGKSTLLNAWCYVLGDLAAQRRLSDLTGERMRFSGTDLVNRRLVWFDEVDVRKSEMGNSLGLLVTGKKIRIERKGVNAITEADNKVKCVVTANALPASAEQGIFRRLILIEFPVSYANSDTRDPHLYDKLKEESSGILNRMLRGLQDLRENHGFTKMEGEEERLEEYKTSSDVIMEYLDTYFEPTTDDSEAYTWRVNDLYEAFSTAYPRVTFIQRPNYFARLLSAQGLEKFQRTLCRVRGAHGVRLWKGLRLKDGYKMENKDSDLTSVIVRNEF